MISSFKHAGLMQMQAARTKRNDDIAWLDRDGAAAFAIVVGQVTAQRGEHIGDAQHQVLPGVGHRVFEIEHYAGGAGIQHFYD